MNVKVERFKILDSLYCSVNKTFLDIAKLETVGIMRGYNTTTMYAVGTNLEEHLSTFKKNGYINYGLIISYYDNLEDARTHFNSYLVYDSHTWVQVEVV